MFKGHAWFLGAFKFIYNCDSQPVGWPFIIPIYESPPWTWFGTSDLLLNNRSLTEMVVCCFEIRLLKTVVSMLGTSLSLSLSLSSLALGETSYYVFRSPMERYIWQEAKASSQQWELEVYQQSVSLKKVSVIESWDDCDLGWHL